MPGILKILNLTLYKNMALVFHLSVFFNKCSLQKVVNCFSLFQLSRAAEGSLLSIYLTHHLEGKLRNSNPWETHLFLPIPILSHQFYFVKGRLSKSIFKIKQICPSLFLFSCPSFFACLSSPLFLLFYSLISVLDYFRTLSTLGFLSLSY